MRLEYRGKDGTVNELGLFVKIGGELCPKHHPFAVVAQGASEYKQFFTAFWGWIFHNAFVEYFERVERIEQQGYK